MDPDEVVLYEQPHLDLLGMFANSTLHYCHFKASYCDDISF